MPIAPAIGGALIGAAGNLIGQGANAFASRRANKRMVDFWNMQNEYNHPKAQMQRLQEAGLNPNLVYGEGTSGATGQADQIGRPDKPEFGNPLSEIVTYQNLKARSAQTDLLEAQVTAEFERARLLANQADRTFYETSNINFADKTNDWAQSQLQASQLGNEMLKRQILGKELDNSFKDASLKKRVEEIFWKAANAEKTFEGKQLNNELLRLQTEFLNLGLDRNSPWYAKIFGNIINKVNQQK